VRSTGQLFRETGGARAKNCTLASNLFGPGWSVWAGRTIACLSRKSGGTFILVCAPAAYYTNNYTHTLAAHRTQRRRQLSLFICLPFDLCRGSRGRSAREKGAGPRPARRRRAAHEERRRRPPAPRRPPRRRR
jgi:hypothetical protein